MNASAREKRREQVKEGFELEEGSSRHVHDGNPKVLYFAGRLAVLTVVVVGRENFHKVAEDLLIFL